MHLVGWNKIIKTKEARWVGYSSFERKEPYTTCKAQLEDVSGEGCIMGKGHFEKNTTLS